MRSSDERLDDVVVSAFYRYVEISDPVALRSELRAFCRAHTILGTILIAPEGLNATVAGQADNITALLALLRADHRFADLETRLTRTRSAPFRRLKVKLKSEILSLGSAGLNPQKSGQRVEPADWNALINDPGVFVLDARNDYEQRLGQFERAHGAGTQQFRDFPEFVARALDPAQTPRVAMYCTGGIRCEKASAYLLAQGFKEVYQLAGGILRYLEEVPAEESTWQGDCFVFDMRVSIDEAGTSGATLQCHACRQPLTPEDINDDTYEAGVSCPRCHGQLSAERRTNLRERRRQVELAAARNEVHIGAVMDVGERNETNAREP